MVLTLSRRQSRSNATAGYEDIGLGGQYYLDNRLNYAGKTIVFVSAIAMESADRTTLDVSFITGSKA